MSTAMIDAMARMWQDLRHVPTAKRIRGTLDGDVVVESTHALLVWEPRRISPMYAVPRDHVRAELTSARPVTPGGPGLIHPGIPFHVHSTDGESLSLSAAGRTLGDAAFRPADADLDGYVVLDFDAFDQWYEEDEPVRAHPRDPFHRLDVRASSRHVRMAHGGQLVVDTRRPVLVFETHLPVRFYVPREDVVADLRPSELTTYCPYKGEANYWSTVTRRDLAWSYQKPLPDAVQLTDLISFYDDVMEVTVDGRPHGRPETAAAEALRDEFGV
jgi:uncharacterized protein (DUF427 family)